MSHILKDHMDVFLPTITAENKVSDRNSNDIQAPYSKANQCCPQTKDDPCMEINRSHSSEKLIKAFSVEENLKTIFNSNIQREVFPVIGGLK